MAVGMRQCSGSRIADDSSNFSTATALPSVSTSSTTDSVLPCCARAAPARKTIAAKTTLTLFITTLAQEVLECIAICRRYSHLDWFPCRIFAGVMTLSSSAQMANDGPASLRTAAFLSALIGCACSTGLVIFAGIRVGSPRLLLVLFALWVAAPFIAIIVLWARAARWSAPARKALYGSALIVALASLAIYASVALGKARPRAPAFVIVPPASLLVTGAVLLLARRRAS
jgi:hypothetical protein